MCDAVHQVEEAASGHEFEHHPIIFWWRNASSNKTHKVGIGAEFAAQKICEERAIIGWLRYFFLSFFLSFCALCKSNFEQKFLADPFGTLSCIKKRLCSDALESHLFAIERRFVNIAKRSRSEFCEGERAESFHCDEFWTPVLKSPHCKREVVNLKAREMWYIRTHTYD